MKRTLFACAAAAALATGADAVEMPMQPSGFGRLDHVFLIMMENQGSTDTAARRERSLTATSV